MSSYWEQRAKELLIENEKSAMDYEEELKTQYEIAIKNINKEIKAFYTTYAENNNISLAEANKILDKKELKSFKQTVKEYLKDTKEIGSDIYSDEYRELLEYLLDRMHISRLQELELNIQNEIEKIKVKQEKGLTEVLKNAYENAYEKTGENINRYAKIGVSFTRVGGKQLETAIKEKWLGENYSARIWTDKTKLVTQLKQTISQEFVRGRSPFDVAEDISKKLNVNLSYATRLVRTELNYISNKGTIQAYKDSKIIKQFQFLAHLDNRTSEICHELDKQTFDIEGAKVGINLPPLHPNCRSTTIPFFED